MIPAKNSKKRPEILISINKRTWKTFRNSRSHKELQKTIQKFWSKVSQVYMWFFDAWSQISQFRSNLPSLLPVFAKLIIRNLAYELWSCVHFLRREKAQEETPCYSRKWGGGTILKKRFHPGRLSPMVKPLILLYHHFWQKGTPSSTFHWQMVPPSHTYLV